MMSGMTGNRTCWMGFMAAVMGTCSWAQTGLYTPAQIYATAVLDNYTVRDVAHNRDIPILIRYPLGTTGPLPMILWSHGGGPQENGKNGADNWGEVLARSGYIVIHMSHVPRTQAQLAALYSEYGVPLNQIPDAFTHLEVDRPRDANAVLADLDGIEAAYPQIRGRIDRQAIGVAGHSFGSYTAMTLAGTRVNLAKAPGHSNDSFLNPLPKSFMAASPQGPGEFGLSEVSYGEIRRPVFFQTGLTDVGPTEQAPPRARAHTLVAPGENYLLFVNSPEVTHDTFNLENTEHPEFSQWIASAGVAWFDATLKGSAAARAYFTSGRTEAVSRSVAAINARLAAPGTTTVSAASGQVAYFAQDAIMTAYGSNLAVSTQANTSAVPPTVLGGISVSVTDGAGTARLAPLFYASPGQVNFLVPEGTATGIATIRVTAAGVTRTTERGVVYPINPGLFSADNSGQGLAAAQVLRVAANGAQTIEAVTRAASIDLGPATDRVYLILYGTGIRRGRKTLGAVGGALVEVQYAGAQGGFPGLDQVNLLLPRTLAGRGEVDVVVAVDEVESNTLKVSIR
jgi:uncharacterized protein (TIGR03437 family)